MDDKVLIRSDLKGMPLFRQGKVRDVYDLGDTLLIVATDRISCFDVVLPCGIPRKGAVLTGLSRFWFDFTESIVPNHLISADTAQFPLRLLPYAQDLRLRSMLVRKTKPLPVECVVRGYLSGSGWKEYLKTRCVCGIPLPSGLKESSRLPEAIFTPSTKEDVGHDINVTQEYVKKQLGTEIADTIKNVSIALYAKAAAYALEKGIIIADTKFEFGLYNDSLILIDEALTPDSSRFWPLDQYEPGRPQPSFDKQFVRDYLESLNWDKTPPAPRLPSEIIAKTSQKYLDAYSRLTGMELKVS